MTAPHGAPRPGLTGQDFSPAGCGCFVVLAVLSSAVVLFFLVPAFVLPWRFWFA